MKRSFILLLFVAASLPAQQAATPRAQVPVATVNGETITAEKLDQMYNRLGAEMREQYDKNGGKAALLENYVRKRLVIQEALKAGFDKVPDVQADMEAAKESTLFDRYVRDVVGASIITDAAMSKYYTQHQDQFGIPAQWKVRHIVITANPNGPQARSKEQALDRIKAVATELHSNLAAVNTAGPAVAAQARLNRFAALARQYSEDSAAASGGDLGWVSRGQLDPDFEAAMLALKPGGMSGIVTTKFGYHIIFLEDQRPASTMSFEAAKPAIREALLTEHGLGIIEAVSKLTNELQASSKISLYPENIK